MKTAFGIDIGGTNTVFGFVNEKGSCLLDDQIPTTDFVQAEELVEAICRRMFEMQKELSNIEISGIGIGAPNGNFYSGSIEFAPNLLWEGVVPLAKMFSDRAGLPAYLTNDANAAAIGEMMYGGAKGMKNFMIVTLGTGVGSGYIVNGDLMYGHDGFAGELGHTIIVEDGRECSCGRKGCLETYTAARGVVHTAYEMLADGKSSLLQSIKSDNLQSKDIGEAAAKGDKIALEVLDYTARKLGMAIANSVAITSPEAIFLFGGVSNAGDLLLEPLKKYIKEYSLNIFKGKQKVMFSTIPQGKAAILGASALVWKCM